MPTTDTDRVTRGASALTEALRGIDRADLVAGIPSYNNAATIAHVVTSVRDGLQASFAEARAVIVNSDGGSADGTREAASALDSDDLRVVALRYAGISGKGSALRAVFEAVDVLGARAGCVLDSDLRSVRPEWVERLLRPIVDGRADYVTPLYARHKHDGTITNTVIYPLVRALFGQRVRQPIGGEFGFSRDLARTYLAQEVWATDVARFGIDVFMTTTALARGARVVQAALGAKIHDPKDPAAHLGPMFSQVVGSTIRQAARYRDAWRAVKGSRALPVEGELGTAEPEAVAIDLAALDGKYVDAPLEARARLSEIAGVGDLERFDAHARARRGADEEIDRVWTRLVYAVVAASLGEPATTDANVAALLPCYFARVAAHVRAAERMSTAEAEALVERQARAFEAERPYLVERASA